MWANVVINEATSGADLIVPRQGAGVGQSARAWRARRRGILSFDDSGVEGGGGGIWLWCCDDLLEGGKKWKGLPEGWRSIL